MKYRLPLLTLFIFSMMVSPLFADGLSGVWISKNLDDSGVRAQIRILENRKKVTGTMMGFQEPENAEVPFFCRKCPQWWKDKSIAGLELLWTEDNGEGRFLNPFTGKVKYFTMKVTGKGDKAEVVIYSFLEIFGHKEIWFRQ